ncbi:glycosidase [Opitutaceae bacterium TAV1]|nr:glycosidase [Opitutaceae bacterium TAV1]
MPTVTLCESSHFASPLPSRAPHPRAWTTRATLYQIWLRSFSLEGTLRVAAAHLPRLAALGVNSLLLSPFLLQSRDLRPEFWSLRMRLSPTGSPANPYRITDYDLTDPEYGTWDDFRHLVREAHRHHIRVLMDVVFYHTGPDCVLTRRPGFYQTDPTTGALRTGAWNFPLPDFSNPQVRRYFIGKLLHWTRDCHVDGYRCDVSSGIPAGFWREARAALDTIAPATALLGDGLPAPSLSDDVFDLHYDTGYYDTLAAIIRHGRSATLLPRHYQTLPPSLRPRLLRLSDALDYERADVAFGETAAAATAVLNLTLDGVPFIYNGQEIGDATPCEIMARHRPVRWDTADFTASNFRSAPRRALYQRLLALRRDIPALAATAPLTWITTNHPDDAVAWLRESPPDSNPDGSAAPVLVVVNLSNRHLEISLDLPLMRYRRLRDLLLQTDLHSRRGLGRPTYELGAFAHIVAHPLGEQTA